MYSLNGCSFRAAPLDDCDASDLPEALEFSISSPSDVPKALTSNRYFLDFAQLERTTRASDAPRIRDKCAGKYIQPIIANDETLGTVLFCFVFCFKSCIFNPLHAARRAMAATACRCPSQARDNDPSHPGG